MQLPDEWHPSADPLSILDIVVPKELDQFVLLVPYPAAEEFPQYVRVGKEANNIAQHKLRPQPPVEEAKVAWMSKQGVDPGSNQLVGIFLSVLNMVVEADASLQHSH